MVKLFSGIAHNSCSEDRALQTSRKRVVTVSKACVTPVILPGCSNSIREGKLLLCEAQQLEAVFCGAGQSFYTAKAVYYSKPSQVTGSKGSVGNLQ